MTQETAGEEEDRKEQTQKGTQGQAGRAGRAEWLWGMVPCLWLEGRADGQIFIQ